MKKILVFTAILAFGFLLSGCNFFGAQTTATTEETVTVDTDVYLEINSVEDLQEIELNRSYILTADIDLSDTEWVPIGDFNDPYRGNFDGDGYTISGLTITDQNNYTVGLFGYLTGNISNLNLTDVSIDYNADFLTYAGAIAGFSFGGDITNCSVSGSIDVVNTQSNTFAGLLVGYTQSAMDDTSTYNTFVRSHISNNTVNGSVTVDSDQLAYVGGFIGKTFNSQVSGNYSDTVVDVTASGSNVPLYVGGFIGHNYGGILQKYDAALEDVSIYIQDNVSFSEITITNTTSSFYSGGFMGFSQQGFIRNNYSESNLTLTGSKGEENSVRIAGYLGENFDCQVENSVIVFSIDDSGFDSEIELDGYVSGVFNDIALENVYLISSSSTSNQLVDTSYTESDLTAQFFTDMLSWDAEFYNQIIN